MTKILIQDNIFYSLLVKEKTSLLNISLYVVDEASNAPETTRFEQTAESAI